VTPGTNPAIIRASLGAYLEELRESGIEGFPTDSSYDKQPITHATVPQDIGLESALTAPPAGTATHHESLENIRKNLGDCKRCKLGTTRKNLVFGVGNPRARLVFVGEGPGADEDTKGEPFVGAAGQVLNRLITNMGLKREEVYICNVVKCRPPGNRDPEPDEVSACSPFLLRQLQSISPEVIVALGKPATQTLLGIKDAISRLRGKFRDFHGIPLMPTYHPSFLLRKQKEGSNEAFWEVWEDMTQVLQLLKLPVPDKSRKT
jgi:DNA polymerase